jgi:hypothetical protein
VTHAERAEFVKAFVENRLLPVLNKKGPDVNLGAPEGADDCNYNFKQLAGRLGIEPRRVWSIYWLKHIMAIETWLSSGKLLSESIEGRIVDAINYLLILATMLYDEKLIDYPGKPVVL